MKTHSLGQKISKIFKHAYPWVLCGLLFVYLFRQVPFENLWLAILNMNPFVFLVTILIYFFVILYADCLALQYFLSRFSAEISFRETKAVRGVSFILSVVNYLMGQAAFAYYLKKVKKAPLAKSLGAVSFVTMMDLILVIFSALVSLSWSESAFATELKAKVFLFEWSWVSALLLLVVYVAWAVFWKSVSDAKIQKLHKYRVMHWVLGHEIFLIFRQANLKDYAVLFLMRAPLLVLVIAQVNFAMLPFASQIAWADVFLYNPIVLLATTLPITPAGLGTSQFLSIEFFSGGLQSPLITGSILTAKELLFTGTLLWYLSNQVLKILYGFFKYGQSKNHEWIQNMS